MERCKLGCKNGMLFMESTHSMVECPECKAKQEKNRLELGLEILKQQEALEVVPEVYRSQTIDDVINLFKHTKLIESFEASDIVYMRMTLENLIIDIANNKIPNRSLFIDAPQFLELERFAYMLQKQANKSSFSFSPYITLNQLACVSKASCGEQSVEGEKVMARYKVTYDDFIDADVCILSCSTNTCESGYGALHDIIVSRSALNKGTIVIGWGIDIKGTSISHLIDDGQTKNRYKSLEIIKCKEKTKGSTDVKHKSFTI